MSCGKSRTLYKNPMKFTKMHGIGNDYIYVNTFEQKAGDPHALARNMSIRRYGVGADGLIFIAPPDDIAADCRMAMYNADGSRAQMCGNGLRCVAKYAVDHGIAAGPEVRVLTDDGLKTCRIIATGPRGAELVENNMGVPRFERHTLPLVDGQDRTAVAIQLPIQVGGQTLRITAVSVGNPHAVLRVDDPDGGAAVLGDLMTIDLESWGPRFEHHPWFPERVNTEFIAIDSRTEILFRVWERGSGETLACGTGACATVVAAVLNGWCDPEVRVQLRGGALTVRWERPQIDDPGPVFLTGEATEVYTGDWPQ